MHDGEGRHVRAPLRSRTGAAAGVVEGVRAFGGRAAPRAATRSAPPAAGPAPRGHIPALDGVRGAAVLAVLVYHFATSLAVLGLELPRMAVLQFGWTGVDVFFTLSGFLITGILLDAKEGPGFFRTFYTRRALRIFPLYYGAIVVVAVLMALLPAAGVWGEQGGLWSPGSLLWPATFMENVALALAGPGGSGLLTHFWSLAVEEHFYLVWPLLVWSSRSPRQVLAWAAVAAAISLTGRVLVWRAGGDLTGLAGLTPLRFDGLALGAATAVLVRTLDARRLAGPATAAAGACLVLLLALLAWRHTPQQTDPAIWLGASPLVSLLTAATILASLGGGLPARVLSIPLLRWFGRYSYGLYVWHPIVNVLVFHSRLSPIQRGDPAAAVLAVFALTLGLDLLVAYLSFHCWEKGFLRLKRRAAPSPSADLLAPSPLARASAERSL